MYLFLKNNKAHLVHGLKKDPLYSVWKTMKKRCENPNSKSYKDYGGRGIAVCDSWKSDFKSFYDWAIINGYQKGLEIDRKNNSGNYCPENCRFVTRKVNGNNKRNNHLIAFNGKVQTLAQWADALEMSYDTLAYRIYSPNWSIEKALTTPVMASKRRCG